MMDVKKKIQILRACSRKKGERCSSCPAFGQGSRNCMKNTMKDAADALEELQGELQKSEHDNVNLTGELAKVAAELERVKAERDAAVERIREWEKFDTYLFVHSFITPEKWRGQKEG